MAYLNALLFICFALSVNGQNLVINGDMEADICNVARDRRTGWLEYGSVDFIHINCQPWKGNDYTIPNNGLACYGLSNGGTGWHPSTDSFPNREYLLGRLKEPLKANQEYSVSFWAKPSHPWDQPWNAWTTSHVALSFQRDTTDLSSRYHLNSMVLQLDSDVLNETGILYDYLNYTKIESCYTAKGGEMYFVIGNFAKWRDEILDTLYRGQSAFPSWNDDFHNLAYVLIDDVVVEEVQDFPMTDTTLCKGEALTVHEIDGLGDITIDGFNVLDSFRLETPGFHTLNVTKGACQYSSDFYLDYIACSECNFVLPNVISVNSSFPNNQMKVSSNCLFEVVSANIVDRWGNNVYSSHEKLDWDGTFKNEYLAQGVYVYHLVVNIKHSDVNEHHLTGTIFLAH